jgi:hypothetical protein
LIALIDNLRDWKRVWNRFRFVEVDIRGQINPIELLALSAIAIKAPTLYEKIVEHPSLFAQDVDFYDAHKKRSLSDSMAALLKASPMPETPQDKRNKKDLKFQNLCKELCLPAEHLVWRLVDELFPKLRHSDYANRPDRASGQLQVYANLRLALNGSHLNDQLTNDDLEKVLFEPGQRSSVLDNVKISPYLLGDLLFELDKRSSQAHQFKKPELLLHQLAEIALLFMGDDFFAMNTIDSFVKNWANTVYEEQDKEAAAVFIENTVNELANSYAGDCVLARTFSEMNTPENDSQAYRYKALREVPTEAQKLAWSTAFGERCINRLDSGDLLNQQRAHTLFWKLPYISKPHFSKIAESSPRFACWGEIMAADRSSGNNQTRFHSINSTTTVLLGSKDRIKQLVATLPDDPVGMVSWKAALLSPGQKFIVGTAEPLNW